MLSQSFSGRKAADSSMIVHLCHAGLAFCIGQVKKLLTLS